MVNYQNGQIYKIVCHETGKVYVGSTCCHLKHRLKEHWMDYQRHLAGRGSYVTSFAVLQNWAYEIVLVERCPCTSKAELRARERHHIERIDCVNKVVPGRTKAEYKRECCAVTRAQNQRYLANPENRLKQQRANARYNQTAKAKQGQAYRSRMAYQWGDRYCNSLSRICWDVFA
jgi:hypothetical protein